MTISDQSVSIVPVKLGNWSHQVPAEESETSGSVTRECHSIGSTEGKTMGILGPDKDVCTKLRRIAELAKVDRTRCLTSLAHNIDLNFLKEAYRQTRKDGAVGVDGQTAADYLKNLDENLKDLLERFKSGRYYAPPVKRVYIEKSGGKKRPLGIPTFEDKVLQRAVKMVLEAIYEEDFYNFSYGFRPKRSVHDALDVLRLGIKKINGGWVLDADIQAFFDELDHGKLREILDQRVRDGVIRRQIDKWLKAGILENKELRYPKEGTPQGGVISPLLANVYLHEVIDTWFKKDVQPRMQQRSFMIRFADDFLMVFESESDARKVLEVLPKRVARFGLRLHPDKTKLVQFNKPSESSKGGPPGPGESKPETFDFLGFTEYWTKSLQGDYWVHKRKTSKKSLRRTCRSMWEHCQKVRHESIYEQHKKLTAKLRGHYNFYGVRGNYRALKYYHRRVERTWKFWLSRRSQKGYLSWERFKNILKRYPLIPPRIWRIT